MAKPILTIECDPKNGDSIYSFRIPLYAFTDEVAAQIKRDVRRLTKENPVNVDVMFAWLSQIWLDMDDAITNLQKKDTNNETRSRKKI